MEVRDTDVCIVQGFRLTEYQFINGSENVSSDVVTRLSFTYTNL